LPDSPELVEVRLPAIADGVAAHPVRFLRRPGESVAKDEAVVEVESDKAVVELVAPHAGVIADVAVADGATVAVGDLLYSLRVAEVSPVADVPSEFPTLTVAQHVWDVSHVRTRARALAPTGAEVPLAETALLLIAVCRALTAAPRLLRRRARWIPGQGSRIWTSLCDVWVGGARWLESELAIDMTIDAALALVRDSTTARPTGAGRPTVRILRLHGDAPMFARTGQAHAELHLTIGPVIDQPAVVAGTLTIRPLAILVIESDAQTTADEIMAFTAALAEQLDHV
jgi:pyruvate/2-oxoglutarate dehydrogenase complex dihydrolipoamide acyltransferase (E2) component